MELWLPELWEELVRENYGIRESRTSTNTVEFDAERADGSMITVRVHRQKVIELLTEFPDQYSFLLDRLHSSMLINRDSSEVELGIIEGWIGFYDPSAQYGVSPEDEASGGFRWSANKPG